MTYTDRRCTTNYLFGHNLMDQYDLVELLDKVLFIVANAVKSGYNWLINIDQAK